MKRRNFIRKSAITMGSAILASELISSSGLAAGDTCGSCTAPLLVSGAPANQIRCRSECGTEADPAATCDKFCRTIHDSHSNCEACTDPDSTTPSTDVANDPVNSKKCTKTCIKEGVFQTCTAVCMGELVSA